MKIYKYINSLKVQYYTFENLDLFLPFYNLTMKRAPKTRLLGADPDQLIRSELF